MRSTPQNTNLNYYPFGSAIESRAFASGEYRFGFNTQESVDEIKGVKNHYTAPFWEYDPRVVTRWNTDPKPNPSFSPYAINQCNPIWYSDPLGDTIKVEHKTGFLGLGKKQTLTYEGGSLYNADGSSYEGKTKGFLKQSLNALNDVRSSREGGTMLEELEGSENVFTLKYGRENSFSASSPLRASANLSEVQAVTGNTAGSRGSGGTIYWNPYSREGGFNTAENRSRPPFVGLGHEFFHGRDANRGTLYPNEDYTNQLTGATYQAEFNGLKKAEWRAVYYENIMRSQLGLPLRTHYGIRETSPGVYSSDGPRLLDGSNQPINYSAR
jgi:hypothetical protein